MITSVLVAGEITRFDPLLAFGLQCFTIRDIVHLQERSPATVGIEHIALLVLTPEMACTERIEHGKSLGRRKYARAEHSHLPLEHLGQRANTCETTLGEFHYIIRMV